MITPDSPSPQAQSFYGQGGVTNPYYDPAYATGPGLGGNMGLDQVVNMILQGGAAQTDLITKQLQDQLNESGAIYGSEVGQLGQQRGFQQQQFGIQGQQLGLQGQSLDQQLANLQAQFGLQQKGFGIQQAGLTAQVGQTQWESAQRQESNVEASAAGGSFGAPGFYRRRGQEQERLGYQLGVLGREQQGLTVQEQQAQQQFTYSQQQLADARQKLKLDYQQMGLSEQEATAAYQNALNKLGLQNVMTTQQLQDEILKAKAGMYTPVSSLFGQLAAVGAPISALTSMG
jgi:hypothetical protein